MPRASCPEFLRIVDDVQVAGPQRVLAVVLERCPLAFAHQLDGDVLAAIEAAAPRQTVGGKRVRGVLHQLHVVEDDPA